MHHPQEIVQIVEIRRIPEAEAETVTVLSMCQEPTDGGPLQPPGRRNIAAQMHRRSKTDVCIDDKAAHTFWKPAGFSADTLPFWNYAPAD